MVFVFATGSFMNANTGVKPVVVNGLENNKIAEYFGCAGDCVRTSKRQALEFTDNWGDDQTLVDNYKRLYQICYDENC